MDEAQLGQFEAWSEHARVVQRRDRMREITRQAHGGQTRNAGRLPYWVHTDAVADICHRALERTQELPADAAQDLVIAAHGHDLYEDTEVSPETIRAQFGLRVDAWIKGATNARDDHDRGDYLRGLANADDEVRLIKSADMIDNMLSVAYGMHDLGLHWVRTFFRPIAADTRDVLLSTPFRRLPQTGAYLTSLVDAAWERLVDSYAASATILALRERDYEDSVAEIARDETLSPKARQRVLDLTFPPGDWDETLAHYKAKEKARGDELFGDGPRFLIPDVDTDS